MFELLLAAVGGGLVSAFISGYFLWYWQQQRSLKQRAIDMAIEAFSHKLTYALKKNPTEEERIKFLAKVGDAEIHVKSFCSQRLSIAFGKALIAEYKTYAPDGSPYMFASSEFGEVSQKFMNAIRAELSIFHNKDLEQKNDQ